MDPLLALILVLLLLWAFGIVVFPMGMPAVKLLLVLALGIVLFRLFSGRYRDV